ncbi:MAG: hypothetical protein AAFQ02_11750 [Bacteroidota bacterium]
MKRFFAIVFFTLLYGSVTLISQEKELETPIIQVGFDWLMEADQSNIGLHGALLFPVAKRVWIGPSVSYYQYGDLLDVSMSNVGVQTRYVLNDRPRVSPFISFVSGLGIPHYGEEVSDEDLDPLSTILLHPAFGLAITTPRNVRIVPSIGYLNQGLDLSFFDRSTISMNYNRYVLSLSIEF